MHTTQVYIQAELQAHDIHVSTYMYVLAGSKVPSPRVKPEDKAV